MTLISAISRIAPFTVLFWLGMSTSSWAADPIGQWIFVDDGTGVDIKPCPVSGDGLCGVLFRLPKSATALDPTQRKQLCNITLIGGLKAGTPKQGEQMRWDGWVIDPEELAKTEQPKHYSSSLILTSKTSARLDVRGLFNLVVESHRLIRPLASTPACEPNERAR
jgi:hypothetical protein